jgi:hypothetical protein
MRTTPKRLCVCGHPVYLHHLTTSAKPSWCTCWDPTKCPCTQYQMANPPDGHHPGGPHNTQETTRAH